MKSLSSKLLTSIGLRLLQKGLNFNLQGKSLMVEEIVPRLEQILPNLKEENVDQAELKICNILRNQQRNITVEKKKRRT